MVIGYLCAIILCGIFMIFELTDSCQKFLASRTQAEKISHLCKFPLLTVLFVLFIVVINSVVDMSLLAGDIFYRY
jgi:hypothetical protein